MVYSSSVSSLGCGQGSRPPRSLLCSQCLAHSRHSILTERINSKSPKSLPPPCTPRPSASQAPCLHRPSQGEAKGQRLNRDAGREKEGDLEGATRPPLTAPSSQRQGQFQPILNPEPCQTDWDCPEPWPLRCGAWDPSQALSGHSQGAKLGEGGRQAGGPGVGKGG